MSLTHRATTRFMDNETERIMWRLSVMGPSTGVVGEINQDVFTPSQCGQKKCWLYFWRTSCWWNRVFS
eukprot:UN12884